MDNRDGHRCASEALYLLPQRAIAARNAPLRSQRLTAALGRAHPKPHAVKFRTPDRQAERGGGHTGNEKERERKMGEKETRLPTRRVLPMIERRARACYTRPDTLNKVDVI